MRSLLMRSAGALWFQTRTRSAPYSSSIKPQLRPLVKAPRTEGKNVTPPAPNEIPRLSPPATGADENER
jgi:hypothetical protein